jgi:xylonate dehydratase
MTGRQHRQDGCDTLNHIDLAALSRKRVMNQCLTSKELREGRPIIGIGQSGSDLSPCNCHHLELAAG